MGVVTDQNRQAMIMHSVVDIEAGRSVPNYSWPEWLAKDYKNLTQIEKEKIMETVEKELKNRKVKKVAKREVEVKIEKKVKKAELPVVEVKKKKTLVKPEVEEEAKKKVGKKVGPRPKSTSGNFKSVRNLIETTFAKNKDTSSDEMMKLVKKEFPTHKYCISNHYPWYKTHIVSRNEWTTVEPPAWSKKPTAKLK